MISNVWVTVADVFHHRAVQQAEVLRNNGDCCPQTILRHLGDVLAVDRDATRLYGEEALQEGKQVRLAASGLANETDALAGGNSQTEILKERPSA